MHYLTIDEPVNLGRAFGILPAGEWLINDLNAFEIAQTAKRGHAKIREFSPPPKPAYDEDSRPVLIVRQGAIGDLLLLSPLFMEWKNQTNSLPSLCCWPRHFDLFQDNPNLRALVPYPLPADQVGNFREIISLENTMESDHENHATDVFAEKLGLSLVRKEDDRPFDYRPVYSVKEEEKIDVQKYLFTGRPNLAVQMRASVANRDYPANQWLEVIVRLERAGWGILLFGHKGQIPPIPPQHASPFIRNLSHDADLTFRQSAAVLSQCQAFVGVDSALIHLCHALDIPAVGLYGPFRWETRTIHAPKTFALTGVGECAPCNWHMHAGRQFPPNKPCTRINQCTVLASIPPDRIVDRINLLKP